MASVRVFHNIGDLASDLAAIPPKAAAQLPGVVKRNVAFGNSVAQRLARESSGPHGKNYWKRITHEMTGPLEGEYGPHGDVSGNAVGAGWRSGRTNDDLPRSLDVVGPKFAKEVGDVADGLFW